MSACDALTEQAALGAAPALRAVDCLAGETTAAAFGRLFGSGGALLPALTIILTLYIAFFAFSLITGRSRIGISALTPRMLTLGMVLTFATSWAAYQGVVWNLAVGAPDQVAGVLMGAGGGSQGTATTLFADRMDIVFAAIAEAANQGQPVTAAAPAIAEGAQQAAPAAAAAAKGGSFSPTDVMWLGALLLLLGTVGVLVTARIALAVLLALGPVFIVFALFQGTRGLCAGWLRGVVLTAVTPLFVVVGGGIVMELLIPVVAMLRDVEGVSGRAALALFLIAAVHVALMAMVTKVAGTMVTSWQVFGLARTTQANPQSAAPQSLRAEHPALAALPADLSGSQRTRLAAMVLPTDEAGLHERTGKQRLGTVRERSAVIGPVAVDAPPLAHQQRRRARGIGSRFAPVQAQSRMPIR